MNIGKTISKDQFCWQCYGSQQKQEFNVQIFTKSEAEKLGLDDTLQENLQFFHNTKDKAFPQNLLGISNSETEQVIVFATEVYDCTLQDIVNTKCTNEKAALQIFRDVIKAVYSLSNARTFHLNIRPEHFVQVKGRWKLKSIVCSNDISKMKGKSSQYAWSPKYKAPEEFEGVDESYKGEGPRKTMVWNLGSLLLDIMLGLHRLKDKSEIWKFKGQKFSFQKMGIKIDMSDMLKSRLQKMLHHNPVQRASLLEIYQDTFFSEEVAAEVQRMKKQLQLADNSDDQAVDKLPLPKISEQGSVSSSIKNQTNKNADSDNDSVKLQSEIHNLKLSSTNKKKKIDNKESERQKISIKDIGSINQSVRKEKIMQSQAMQSNFSLRKLESFDDFAVELNQKSNFIKKAAKPNSVAKKPNSPPKTEAVKCLQMFEKDPLIKELYQKYKTQWDKAQLLCQSSQRLAQIPFNKQQKEQMVLLIKFSVYYYALIDLFRISDSLNQEKNIFKVNNQLFSQFINHIYFDALKKLLNEQISRKQYVLEQTQKQLIQKLKKSITSTKQLKLFKQKDMVDYIQNVDFMRNEFVDIKRSYRRVLKKSYDTITSLYNKQKNQSVCRLSMYAVYCMTADKLYKESEIKQNFALFFEWKKSCESEQDKNADSEGDEEYHVAIHDLQKYFQEADKRILITHSKNIIHKYYKV